MDRSLLFFYGLFIVFVGYYAWKAKKQRVLTSTLWQLAALVISMILASLIAESGTGTWWIIVVVISFVLLAGGMILFLGIKFRRGKNSFRQRLTSLKARARRVSIRYCTTNLTSAWTGK
ncbi:hypothetical protein NLZ15_05355 [Atlantibacter subterranea]|uniref:hypothetical protein n=1 Tax=Atlantibacter subterraneus TaxID=255519 RepID=UPI0020C2A399|nr:hypothetical protein [Atlantibacter subterranea]UTJ48474.1 hypothetical protein NLZ15_05355 [Atlantibacter subterranea]